MMKLSALFLVLCACSTAAPAPAPARPPAPAVARASVTLPADLDEDTRSAVEVLAAAQEFGGAHVGYGGTPTPQVVAFHKVLAHPKATELFEVVIDQGTLPAQMMALAGLYTSDHARFLTRVDPYRARTDTVPVRHDGCLVYTPLVAVGEIVQSTKHESDLVSGTYPKHFLPTGH